MIVLALLAKVTFVCAAALLAGCAAWRLGAAARHLIFSAAFVTLLGLPLGLLIRPIEIPIPVAVAPVSFPQRPEVIPVVQLAPPDKAAGVDPADATVAAAAWQLPQLATMAYAAWLAGALLFALPMAIGQWQLWRIRRNGLRWPNGTTLVENTARTQGVGRHVTVLLDEQVRAPFTFGLMRPVMVFPADVREWSAQDLERAIVHEVAHVKRADWLTHCVARLLCAAYWFHPLVWMAWRRLELEAERAADDVVLQHADAAGYADQLILLAQQLARADGSRPVLAMAGRSDLSARVASVLDARRSRRSVQRTTLLAAAVSVVGLIALAGPLRVVPLAQPSGVDITLPSSVNAQRPVNSESPDATRVEVQNVEPSASQSGDAPLLRQSFESVSIIAASFPNATAVAGWAAGAGTCGGPRLVFSISGNRFSAERITLCALIRYAYGIQEEDIVVPEWAARREATTYYDIDARAAAGTVLTDYDNREMVRTLLVDRFNLRYHVERGETPIYALVTDREGGGPRLSVSPSELSAPDGACIRGAPFVQTRRGLIAACSRGITLVQLAQLLSRELDRPVVNWTGISGPQAFVLRWQNAGARSSADSRPPLSSALQEQLGLRLESHTAMLERMIVDHAEPPSLN